MSWAPRLTLKETTMRTSVKALATGSLAVTFLFVAPSAFADNTATVEVTGGEVSANAQNVDLGAVKTAHTAQNVSGGLDVTVDDGRGTGAGWVVTQQVTNFTSGDQVIPAGNFSVATVGAASKTAGKANEGEVIASGTAGALSTPHTVLSAAAGSGEGAYTAAVGVNLLVPADTRVGTYTATLTTTVSAPVE